MSKSERARDDGYQAAHCVVRHVTAIISAICVDNVLAWVFTKLHVAHALIGLAPALVWFTFLFVQYSTISVFSAFETNPWPLILVNMGRPMLIFAISGIVLQAWR